MRQSFIVVASKITYNSDIESKIQKIRNLLNNFHGIIPDGGRSVRVRRTEDSVIFTGRYDFISNPEMLDIFTGYGEEAITNFEIADNLYDGEFSNLFKDLFVPELQQIIRPFKCDVQTSGLGSVMYLKFRLIIDLNKLGEEGYEEE